LTRNAGHRIVPNARVGVSHPSLDDSSLVNGR
jgi:hypothetical protein